ncbi:MAG: methyltransferase [Alphaproteobacteria bacterium]|nr:MAG: methyltransferase [Alphaproteobacteria bacterium]
MTPPDPALLRLLRTLKALDYRFVAVTPETHRRVLARPGDPERGDLRDVFGWNRPFQPESLPAELLAGGVEEAGDGLVRSRYRVASLEAQLFLHSSYPTDDEHAVFFGPDTYRFARFIEAELEGRPAPRSILDIGCGTGAGGLTAAALAPGARVMLSDVNPAALSLAAVNAAAAGVAVELIEGSGVPAAAGAPELIVANPPYIADDDAGRSYRDGGGAIGSGLSLEWAFEGARRLAPGGRMLLYTGVAIVGGEDRVRAQLEAGLPALGCGLRYSEIDPDVFGEELDKPPYAGVERIVAVGAVIEKLRSQ